MALRSISMLTFMYRLVTDIRYPQSGSGEAP